MTIIPAIDIIDGNCVRLSKGAFDTKKVYHSDPLEVARQFEAAGLKRLHLVDLDGAREGTVKNWPVLQSIASSTKLEIDFSGGLSTSAQLEKALDAGAAYLSIGSMAVKDKPAVEGWIRRFGAERFIIGGDLKNGKVAIKGWQSVSDMGWKELIKSYSEKGIKQFFCTDVSRDGLLEGPSIELYQEILSAFPGISLIASGGVSSLQDLEDLRSIGCTGAIVGKAIYENRISLEELKTFAEPC